MSLFFLDPPSELSCGRRMGRGGGWGDHQLLSYHLLGCAGSSPLLGFFSSCRERGPLCPGVRGLLTAAASLVVEQGLQGAWASVGAAPGL